MSRSADQVREEMLALLPPGWAWPRGADSVLAAVLTPMATGIAELEAAAAAAMDEIDPRTSVAFLPDIERTLGADPCGRDLAGLPLGERRRIAHARWTARGGASRDYFHALAAVNGTPITITELISSQAGLLQAGDELVSGTEPFVWVVTLRLGSWRDFECGAGGAGDLLYEFALSDLECEIVRRRPAHTEAAFFYVEAE